VSYTTSSASTHTIGASYGGSDDHAASSDPDGFNVTVNPPANTAPVVAAPTCLPEPSTVGQSVTCSASFTDDGLGGGLSCTVNFGDGTTLTGALSGDSTAGTCTATHTYTTADTFTVTVTVNDGELPGSNSTTHQVNPTGVIVDYGVVTVDTHGSSFENPSPWGMTIRIHTVVVKNFGTVTDGPARVSLVVKPDNPSSCPKPLVLPLRWRGLKLKPGKQANVSFLVVYRSCGDPSPPIDYWVTGTVLAPGDTKHDNDSKTVPLDAKPRPKPPWWWWCWCW